MKGWWRVGSGSAGGGVGVWQEEEPQSSCWLQKHQICCWLWTWSVCGFDKDVLSRFHMSRSTNIRCQRSIVVRNVCWLGIGLIPDVHNWRDLINMLMFEGNLLALILFYLSGVNLWAVIQNLLCCFWYVCGLSVICLLFFGPPSWLPGYRRIPENIGSFCAGNAVPSSAESWQSGQHFSVGTRLQPSCRDLLFLLWKSSLRLHCRDFK